MNDKPYAGLTLRYSGSPDLFRYMAKEPRMIDKSKPFYIVRSPEFGTGQHYTPARNGFPARDVPELWRAKESRDEAIASALNASAHGKQFDVFELRLVGSTAPPAAQWVAAKKPRRVRKAKRKVRR